MVLFLIFKLTTTVSYIIQCTSAQEYEVITGYLIKQTPQIIIVDGTKADYIFPRGMCKQTAQTDKYLKEGGLTSL